MKIDIKEITKVKIVKGEVLYVEYPAKHMSATDKEELEEILERYFPQAWIMGHIPLKFSSVKRKA